MLFLQTCSHFSHLILYHIPHFYSFFSFEYFDSFDHYAACWVTLTFSLARKDFEGVCLNAASECIMFLFFIVTFLFFFSIF